MSMRTLCPEASRRGLDSSGTVRSNNSSGATTGPSGTPNGATDIQTQTLSTQKDVSQLKKRNNSQNGYNQAAPNKR